MRSAVFNGTPPTDLWPVSNGSKVFKSASTGKFYKKVGWIIPKWKEFTSIAEAEAATGGARRKTRGRGRGRNQKNKRKSRRSRS